MTNSLARTLRRAGALRVFSDRALADLAAGGDGRAADALLARHERAMCRLVAGLAGDGPAGATAAAAALDAARNGLVDGLPPDRAPRLSLLSFAYSCAAGSPRPGIPEDLARLPSPERAALVLAGTVGLSSAAASLVMETTPEHVDALLRAAEADLSGFPPAGPDCVDARSEVPPRGALAGHAAGCPPCAAFAVERSRRTTRLATIVAVTPALAAASSPPRSGSYSAPPRPVPRVELAMLGTVGLVVVSVGVTLGVVLTTSSTINLPVGSSDEIRPRPLPQFPDVAEAERVSLVARSGPLRSASNFGAARGRATVAVSARIPSPRTRIVRPSPPSSAPGAPGSGDVPVAPAVPPAAVPAVAVVGPPPVGQPVTSPPPAISPDTSGTSPGRARPARRKKRRPVVTPPAPPPAAFDAPRPPSVPEHDGDYGEDRDDDRHHGRRHNRDQGDRGDRGHGRDDRHHGGDGDDD